MGSPVVNLYVITYLYVVVGRKETYMLDRLGTLFAGLCAVHCALVPVAIAATSSFTLALLSWQDPHHGLAMWLLRLSAWEGWVVGGALTFATISFGVAFPSHRDPRPLTLLFIAAAAFFGALCMPVFRAPAMHALLAVLGGGVLVTAHLANLRARPRVTSGR
jgi:hypothetical protein